MWVSRCLWILKCSMHEQRALRWANNRGDSGVTLRRWYFSAETTHNKRNDTRGAQTNHQKVSCAVCKEPSDAALTFRLQFLRLSPRCPCTRTEMHGTSALQQVQCALRNRMITSFKTEVNYFWWEIPLCHLSLTRCTLNASLWRSKSPFERFNLPPITTNQWFHRCMSWLRLCVAFLATWWDVFQEGKLSGISAGTCSPL